MLYDLNGNRTERKGGRLGVDGTLQEMDTAYSYDHMNRLTEEQRITDGDRYSYDPAGNRIRKQHYHHVLNSENNFSSDSAAASRMIDAEETYCYNERNELTKRKTLSEMTEYLYDENGSLVREKEGSRTASCRYDLLNRQTHVTTFDGREQENLYDGEAASRIKGKWKTIHISLL